MDLVLHIGGEKTGSTRIQGILAKRRAELAAQGVILPRSVEVGPGWSLRLALVAAGEEAEEVTWRFAHVHDPRARDAAVARWRRALEAEVARSDARAAVISSEHLQSQPLSAERLRAFAAWLRGVFGRVQVVCYLRDPVEGTVSLHSTALKSGAVSSAPPPPEDEVVRRRFDHAAILGRWAEAFGRDAMEVRLFRRDELVGGDVWADFHACALAPLGVSVPPIEAPGNESLDRVGFAVLPRVNRLTFDPAAPPSAWRDAQELRSILAYGLSHGGRAGIDPEMLSRYRDVYDPVLERVRAEWFPHREALFERAPRPAAEPVDLTEAELDALAAVIVDAWRRRLPSRPPDGRLVAWARALSHKLSSLRRRLRWRRAATRWRPDGEGC